MEKAKFQFRIFILLLISKLIAIGTLIFEWLTNGFSSSEFTATFTLILPLFSVYTTLIFKEFLGNPIKNVNKESDVKDLQFVKKIIVNIAHYIIPLYGIIIAILIIWKPIGILSFNGMQAAIAGVESFLGVYIGQLVFALFKKS